MTDVSNKSEDVLAALEEMGRPELIKRAISIYGLQVQKEWTKEHIISAIKNKLNKSDYALPAVGDAPAPGRTRIRIEKAKTGKEQPVFIGINGYRITIKRGEWVDVPHKVVSLLDTAREYTLQVDEEKPFNDPTRERWVWSHSYPFSTGASTPGPDPKPGDELVRGARAAAKREFADSEGYWPTEEQLRAAQKDGMFKAVKPKKSVSIQVERTE